MPPLNGFKKKNQKNGSIQIVQRSFYRIQSIKWQRDGLKKKKQRRNNNNNKKNKVTMKKQMRQKQNHQRMIQMNLRMIQAQKYQMIAAVAVDHRLWHQKLSKQQVLILCFLIARIWDIKKLTLWILK